MLPATALIVVIVLCTPLVAPVDFAHQQYTHDLYGWWYFPFLVAVVICHLGCLLAAAKDDPCRGKPDPPR